MTLVEVVLAADAGLSNRVKTGKVAPISRILAKRMNMRPKMRTLILLMA